MPLTDRRLHATRGRVRGVRCGAQLFGIHPLTVEDIVTRSDREKCEQYDNYTFIVSRALVDFEKCVCAAWAHMPPSDSSADWGGGRFGCLQRL